LQVSEDLTPYERHRNLKNYIESLIIESYAKGYTDGRDSTLNQLDPIPSTSPHSPQTHRMQTNPKNI